VSLYISITHLTGVGRLPYHEIHDDRDLSADGTGNGEDERDRQRQPIHVLEDGGNGTEFVTLGGREALDRTRGTPTM